MSTRAHVIIKDESNTVYVYHHCDGYPDGVGEDLKSFIFKYGKTASIDAENFANFLTEYDNEFRIDECIHGDEEYIYIIDLEKETMKCYEIWGNLFKKLENHDDALEEFRVFTFGLTDGEIELGLAEKIKEEIRDIMKKHEIGTGSSFFADILRELADEIDD